MRKFKQVITYKKEIPSLLFKKLSKLGAEGISLSNSEPKTLFEKATVHGIVIEKKIVKWLVIIWREPVSIDNIIKVEKFLHLLTEN